MTTTENPNIHLGANNPPSSKPPSADTLKLEIEQQHADLFKRVEELIKASLSTPAVVSDDETAGSIGDLKKMLALAKTDAENRRKTEKSQWDNAGKVVHNIFEALKDRLDQEISKLAERQDKYMKEKEARERIEREERAERERKEQERLKAEAEEKRQTEERLKAEAAEAERKAEAARAEKARQLSLAKTLREHATAIDTEIKAMNRSGQEQQVTDRETRSRLFSEEAELREQGLSEEADKKAQERGRFEADLIARQNAEIRRQNDLIQAQEKLRKAEEEARQQAQKEADAAAQADKLEKAKAAEARGAGKEARVAEVMGAKTEKLVAKLEDAAAAPAAELSRVRGEAGSVSSLATLRKFRIVDRAALEPTVIWPFLTDEDIDKAIGRMMAAKVSHIKGVEFYDDESGRTV